MSLNEPAALAACGGRQCNGLESPAGDGIDQGRSIDACHVTCYMPSMIEGFRHKGLRRYFEDDDRRLLPPDMVERIGIILSALDAARIIEDLRRPSFRLHQLKGELKGFWAMTVRANWRIVFRFENGQVFDVDFVDYH